MRVHMKKGEIITNKDSNYTLIKSIGNAGFSMIFKMLTDGNYYALIHKYQQI